MPDWACFLRRREADKVLKTLIVGHVAEETKLREKKFKMETEKDNWIAKYDKVINGFKGWTD